MGDKKGYQDLEAEAHSQFYNKKSGDFGEMSEDNFVHTLSFTQNEIEAGSFCLDDIRTTVSRELSDINESQNDQSEIAEQEKSLRIAWKIAWSQKFRANLHTLPNQMLKLKETLNLLCSEQILFI